MFKLIKRNWILIVILVLGLFLRAWHPLQLFQYGHDNDLGGWIVRDVLVNHHLRLIGQETSSHGIFIGPYFYYLQIPFYLLTAMDPSGILVLSSILGIFAIFSIYFVLKEMFNKNVGFIGSFIYAVSVLIVFTDREVVPTMPVVLWTVWFLYALSRILKNKKNAYLIIGVLVGLIWSINLQLVILLPLVLLAQILSKKRINFKELAIGILVALILNIPFGAFELRHGFQQTRALFSSLTTNRDYVSGTSMGFFPKLDRTMQIVYKNTTNMFWDSVFNVPFQITFWLLSLTSVFLVWKKKINLNYGIILFLWQFIYILFFTKVSLNISEYYINGMNVVWIIIFACGVEFLIKNSKLKLVGIVILLLFTFINMFSFLTRKVNANGYLERKAVIQYIKDDSVKHGYPCVSLSFITSPGNDFGYRYFTWELGLKTKAVTNSVPVYSIVFPLSKVDEFDKSFGALGVVLPDYKRYNDSTIQKACDGSDFTVMEPMFGFTK